jgi:hypothetical protein
LKELHVLTESVWKKPPHDGDRFREKLHDEKALKLDYFTVCNIHAGKFSTI